VKESSGAEQPAGGDLRLARADAGGHRPSLKEFRPAVFFDRDGTLIKDVGYIGRPEDVELVPDAAQAVRWLNNALRPVIVATNQSGIARGMFSEQDYVRVRDRLDDLLAERGAYIYGHYHCPHHPDYTGPCFCRKPGTELFDRAMAEHVLNPAMSAWVGDRWRDIAPALHFGGQGILVPSPVTPAEDIARATRELAVAATLTDAVHLILHV
jgi:D-glycero-D-manno-heptose 1,7-bisphosphate phosphatase